MCPRGDQVSIFQINFSFLSIYGRTTFLGIFKRNDQRSLHLDMCYGGRECWEVGCSFVRAAFSLAHACTWQVFLSKQSLSVFFLKKWNWTKKKMVRNKHTIPALTSYLFSRSQPPQNLFEQFLLIAAIFLSNWFKSLLLSQWQVLTCSLPAMTEEDLFFLHPYAPYLPVSLLPKRHQE